MKIKNITALVLCIIMMLTANVFAVPESEVATEGPLVSAEATRQFLAASV